MVQDKGKLVHSHPANELTEKLFGFESVINKIKTVDADATTFEFVSEAVPTGKIWKITYITAWNDDGDISEYVVFYVNHDGVDITIHKKIAATAQFVSVEILTECYLDVEDYIRVRLKAVGIGETVNLSIFGYEMNAP